MTFLANEFETKIANAKGVYVDRKEDNSGTYVYTVVCDENDFVIFVPNYARVRGEWLYYSQNVRDMIKTINSKCEILETPKRGK